MAEEIKNNMEEEEQLEQNEENTDNMEDQENPDSQESSEEPAEEQDPLEKALTAKTLLHFSSKCKKPSAALYFLKILFQV